MGRKGKGKRDEGSGGGGGVPKKSRGGGGAGIPAGAVRIVGAAVVAVIAVSVGLAARSALDPDAAAPLTPAELEYREQEQRLLRDINSSSKRYDVDARIDYAQFVMSAPLGSRLNNEGDAIALEAVRAAQERADALAAGGAEAEAWAQTRQEPHQLARAWQAAGIAAAMRGDVAVAISRLDEAVAVMQVTQGPPNPQLSGLLKGMAGSLRKYIPGAAEDAAALLTEALDDDMSQLLARHDLALTLGELGKVDAAAAQLDLIVENAKPGAGYARALLEDVGYPTDRNPESDSGLTPMADEDGVTADATELGTARRPRMLYGCHIMHRGFVPHRGWKPDRTGMLDATEFEQRFVKARRPVVMSLWPQSSDAAATVLEAHGGDADAAGSALIDEAFGWRTARWSRQYMDSVAGDERVFMQLATEAEMNTPAAETDMFGLWGGMHWTTLSEFLAKAQWGDPVSKDTTAEDAAFPEPWAQYTLNLQGPTEGNGWTYRQPLRGVLGDDIKPAPPVLRQWAFNAINIWLGHSSLGDVGVTRDEASGGIEHVGAGSCSKLHFDGQDNLIVVLRGTKHITLFPPYDGPRLYSVGTPALIQPTGEVDFADYDGTPSLHFSRVNLGGFSSHNRTWDADTDDVVAQWPRLGATTRVELSLRAGETFYMPSGWWHRICSFGSHLAVNYWASEYQLADRYPELQKLREPPPERPSRQKKRTGKGKRKGKKSVKKQKGGTQ